MKKETTDILIMGSGAAGFAAAIEAAGAGAKVIVLEKNGNYGGVSVTGMGLFAVESHHQRAKNVDFTKDDAFKLFMEETQWRADAKLVRKVVNKTADTIKWLEDMGVVLALLDKNQYPGAINQTGHLVISPKVGVGPTATADMVFKMKDRAEALGADVRNQATVTDIEHVGNEYLVKWTDAEGEANEITASAVVIAAGGFAHDAELAERQHVEYGKNFAFAHRVPQTGEGIRMAWKLGAVEDGMAMLYTTYMDAMSGHYGPSLAGLFNLAMFSFPYLWVNSRGERFVDEGNLNGAYMGNALARQKDGVAYLIFDKSIVDRIKAIGPDVGGYLTADKELDLDAEFDKALEANLGEMFFRADSLEELAEKVGLPYEAFKATIDEYNHACDTGYDELFAKDRRYLQPVRTPRFYAIRRNNSGYGSVGGIRIDHNAAAIGADWEPIPGLYAAGDCANGTIAGNTALMYKVWGGTLSFATNSGRIAGESAAAYIKSLKA